MDIHEPGHTAVTGSACPSPEPCKQDDIGEIRSSFGFCALLLLDTYDAYRQCDGDRIFRNTRFEFLLCDASHHIKYRLNLWRMMAYDLAILSAREAYEYRWNCSVNLQGGQGCNIANDNMVEIHVGQIKKRLKAQGSNMTFKSAQIACDTLQIHQVLCQQIQKEAQAHQASRKRPEVLKHKDVEVMARQLLDAGFLHHQCNSESQTFKNFVNPLHKVNMVKLCEWMRVNKDRAAVEMVRA